MEKMEILEVLNILKVTKYEDIDKFKALEIARLFPKISELAFESLFNQVPNFFALLEEGLKAEKEVISKSSEQNAENMKSLNKQFEIILETLRDCQKKPNISFEESKYYIEKMYDVLILSGQKDTENKDFIEKNIETISDRINSNQKFSLGILAGLAGVVLVAAGLVSNMPYLTNTGIKK
jgi:hypothetical protein